MVQNFIIPEEVVARIPDTDIDPVKQQKLKLAKEKQEAEDLCEGARKIENDPKIIEACKHGALLIKDEKGYNLYLGYALDVHKHTSLCFFWSHEAEKDDGEFKPNRIDTYFSDAGKDLKNAGISNYEELYDLVNKAVSARYIVPTTEKANEELNETLQSEKTSEIVTKKTSKIKDKLKGIFGKHFKKE